MKERKIFLLLALFSLLGLIAASLALKEHAAHAYGLAGSSFCNISSTINCAAALESSWSMVHIPDAATQGICRLFANPDIAQEMCASVQVELPLALIGVAYYLLLILTALVSYITPGPRRGVLLDAFVFVGGLALLHSLLLLYISLTELSAVCPLCLTMYVANLAIFLTALLADREENFIVRLLTGAISVITAPLRFFLVWFRSADRDNRAFAILELAVLVAAIFFSNFYLEYLLATQQANQTEAQLELPWPKTGSLPLEIMGEKGPWGDYSQGAAGSPIQMVEFMDFECPYCRVLFPALEELLREFPDKIHYTIKNYPLSSKCNPAITSQGHLYACELALVARCAGEQGRFWEAARYYSETDWIDGLEKDKQSADTNFRKGLEQMTAYIGIDDQELSQCLTSKRQEQYLLRDVSQGTQLKLTGTPSLFINGKLLRHPDKATIKKVIEDILAPAQAS